MELDNLHKRKHISLVTHTSTNVPMPHEMMEEQRIQRMVKIRFGVGILLTVFTIICLVVFVSGHRRTGSKMDEPVVFEDVNIKVAVIKTKNRHPKVKVKDCSIKDKVKAFYSQQLQKIDSSTQIHKKIEKFQNNNSNNHLSHFLPENQYSLVSILHESSHRFFQQIVPVPIYVAKYRKLTSYSLGCSEKGDIQKILGFFINLGDDECWYEGADEILEGESNERIWRGQGMHFTVALGRPAQIGVIQIWLPFGVKAKQIHFFGIRVSETVLTMQKTLETQYIDTLVIGHSGLNVFTCQTPECDWTYSMIMLVMEPSIQLTGLKIFEIFQQEL